jgi:type III pantothenate kinase
MHEQIDLVVDMGNSRVKAALFRSGRIASRTTFAHQEPGALESFLASRQPRRVVVGSVGPDPSWLVDRMSPHASVFVVDPSGPLPLKSAYATPTTLGVDRIANAVGGRNWMPGRPLLIIDAGTCITYDLVEADGTYAGGAISPGWRMRAQAMHQYSARLPLVMPQDDPPLLGNSTAASLASGIQHGTTAEIKGMIEGFGHQRPGMAVILTGGDALRAARALKSGIFAHPDLTLEGLYALLVHHHEDHGLAGIPGPRRT